MNENVNNNSNINKHYVYSNMDIQNIKNEEDIDNTDINNDFEADKNQAVSDFIDDRYVSQKFSTDDSVVENTSAKQNENGQIQVQSEFENQRNIKETELSNAKNAYYKVYSGGNDNVNAAKEKYTAAKEEYEKLLEKEGGLMTFRKSAINDSIKAVEEAEALSDAAEIKQQANDNIKTEQEYVIYNAEEDLKALNAALADLENQHSNNETKQVEINSKITELKTKISEAEERLNNEKNTLEKLNQKQEVKKEKPGLLDKVLNFFGKKPKEEDMTYSEIKEQLINAKKIKKESELEYILNNKNISSKLKEALKNYLDADKNLENVKTSEAQAAKSAIIKAQSELKEISGKINEKKAEEIKKENSVSAFTFDFEERLTSEQKEDLEIFKNKYEQNKEKYKEVERQTGVPAELVAAIHYRESNGNFKTYLHNGDYLGKPTQNVPAGIYFDTDQWTEAAVDALKREGCDKIDTKNLDSLLDFAERYNGLGYRRRNIASPYVWAGTDRYVAGKFVRDSEFDKNYVDRQLGVAVMMKAIC